MADLFHENFQAAISSRALCRTPDIFAPTSELTLGAPRPTLCYGYTARACRMALGQYQDLPQADPGGRVIPRFFHRLISFRHFISGSLALASQPCLPDLCPGFPQRSPPLLLTTAACGGLRSAPDRRPRRALLHLSCSYAPSSQTALVTHDPNATSVSHSILLSACAR